jgi:hypothetical protein
MPTSNPTPTTTGSATRPRTNATDASTQGPCPTPVVPKDTTPPALSISSAKTLRLSKAGALSFVLTTDENVAGTASGTISLPNVARAVRFKTTKVKLTGGKLTKVTLKVSKSSLKAVRKALKHHKLKAKIAVTVKDIAGNKTVHRLTQAEALTDARHTRPLVARCNRRWGFHACVWIASVDVWPRGEVRPAARRQSNRSELGKSRRSSGRGAPPLGLLMVS